MNKLSQMFAGVSLVALAVAGILSAQETKQVHPGKGGSPHVTTTYNMGGKSVAITYGRPSKKNRVIFGQTIPFGKVWRLGADEARRPGDRDHAMLSIEGRTGSLPGRLATLALLLRHVASKNSGGDGGVQRRQCQTRVVCPGQDGHGRRASGADLTWADPGAAARDRRSDRRR